METRVWTVCRVDKRSRKEKWKRIEKELKRAFALLAVVTCEQRKTAETRGRVACHLVKRPRKERWKREFGLLAMPTCEPRKKDGNASAGCTQSRHAAQERKMDTRVWTVCRVDRRHRQERWKRMCRVLVTPTRGTRKKDGNVRSRCSQCYLANREKRWKRVVGLLAT